MIRMDAEYGKYSASRGADDNFRPNISLERPEAVRGMAAPRGFVFLFIVVWVFLLSVAISTHELSRPNWLAVALSMVFAVAVALVTFGTETYVTRGVKQSH
jgi:hypothetical protein